MTWELTLHWKKEWLSLLLLGAAYGINGRGLQIMEAGFEYLLKWAASRFQEA